MLNLLQLNNNDSEINFAGSHHTKIGLRGLKPAQLHWGPFGGKANRGQSRTSMAHLYETRNKTGLFDQVCVSQTLAQINFAVKRVEEDLT